MNPLRIIKVCWDIAIMGRWVDKNYSYWKKKNLD